MKRVPSGGFTVVETMIVLAVSGVLFVSLVGAVQGQQGKAQFKNSVTNVVSDIQSTIGQVTSGYYPAAEQNFRCITPSGAPILTANGSNAELGTQENCTFMGQAILFGTGVAQDEQLFNVQTLIGVRKTILGKDPVNFSESNVRSMAPGTSLDDRNFPNHSVTKNLTFGTTIKWMRMDNATSGPIAGFAIVAAPGGLQSTGGTLLASIIPIGCGSRGSCEDGLNGDIGVDAIRETFSATGPASPVTSGVKLCFLGASNSQSALVRIGANGGNNSIETTIYPNPDCL